MPASGRIVPPAFCAELPAPRDARTRKLASHTLRIRGHDATVWRLCRAGELVSWRMKSRQPYKTWNRRARRYVLWVVRLRPGGLHARVPLRGAPRELCGGLGLPVTPEYDG